LLLYGMKKGPDHRWMMALDLGGRYWDRTSDLFGVKERSRSAGYVGRGA